MDTRKILFGMFFTLLVNCLFSQSGSIEGEVKNEKQGEIHNATVSLFGKDGELLTKTDIDGSYIFKNLQAGEYKIEFSLKGYLSSFLRGVIVKNEQPTFVFVMLKIDKEVEIRTLNNQRILKKRSRR